MSLSRNVLSLVASCAVLLAVACGGTAEERLPAPSAPAESSEVQALATCTARCMRGTVSCTGNTCQTVDGQYVACDGRRTYCPQPDCTTSVFCESLGYSISCSGYNNSCRQEGPQNSKVCGGVTCDGVTQWCPPFQDARECY